MADYRGARGSNAGDDFHELWAMQQALGLLTPNTNLVAVTVEGLSIEDETGSSTTTWDGVDCAFYYGADSAKTATRIIVDQLKYSGADPATPWTVARLTQSKGQKTKNSAIQRLASAFAGLVGLRGGSSDGIVVRLVSNQPVDQEVIDALHTPAAVMTPQMQELREQLQKASGLTDILFSAFTGCLDLRVLTGSRFQLTENVLLNIAQWADDDTSVVRDKLQRYIHDQMLPENKGQLIKRASILITFGFSAEGALFPCPSFIKRVKAPIMRSIAADAIQKLTDQRRICIHGSGGCGKTTVLQEIREQLPGGSVMIIFDCYGGGDYLDPNAYRHQGKDAFRQIINEVTGICRIPLLLTTSKDANYARLFVERLNRAAEALAAENPNALLVIAVDAADNSVIAANSIKPQDHSFVHDFMRLGGIKDNIRFVVTTRTGRLGLLDLPPTFLKMEMGGFEGPETAIYVKKSFPAVSDIWLSDFHRYSNGNPRVQTYALEYGKGDSERALAYLLPQGKGLEEIFTSRLQEAALKAGGHTKVNELCGALIALPRPIPVRFLAAVTGNNVQDIRDTCIDLNPAIRLDNDKAALADEDFEAFLRDQAEAVLPQTLKQVAILLLEQHTSDEYAAINVASALHSANRYKELIQLLETESEPTAVRDPLVRREVQVQRFRLGLAAATELKDMAHALQIMLYGGEALKTEAAIQDLIIKNPGLVATFMPDSAYKMVLSDPSLIEHHGPLLFHFLLRDAARNDRVLFRKDRGQLDAWLQRRKNEHDSSGANFHMWSISEADIAAEAEAVLMLSSVGNVISYVNRWRPKQIRGRVARELVAKLLISGRIAPVQECLDQCLVKAPWTLLLLVPLIQAGEHVDTKRVEEALQGVLPYVRLTRRYEFSTDDYNYFWLDTLLIACEFLVRRNGNREVVQLILHKILNTHMGRKRTFYSSGALLLDVVLRAYCLQEYMNGLTPDLTRFFQAPPSESQDTERKTQTTVSVVFPLYRVRAQLMIDCAAQLDPGALLKAAIAEIKSSEYKLGDRYDARQLRRALAVSLVSIKGIADVDPTLITDSCLSLLFEPRDPLGSDELKIFAALVLDKRLHARILMEVSNRASSVMSLRTAASEKIEAILKLARLLLPVSRTDAHALFNQAHNLTEELDADSVYQLRAVGSIAAQSSKTMNPSLHREAAAKFGAVVADSAIRLSEQERFPWKHCMSALVSLDAPIALAVLARWQDSGIVDLDLGLNSILEAAVSGELIKPEIATALLPLLELPEPAVFRAIISASNTVSHELAALIRRELARGELIQFGERRREEIVSLLDTSDFTNADPSLAFLKASLNIASPDRKRNGTPKQVDDPIVPLGVNPAPPQVRSYATAAEIGAAFKDAKSLPDGSRGYPSITRILKQVRPMVAVGDYVNHLNAISELPKEIAPSYDIGRALSDVLSDWHTPAVNHWCQKRLPEIILRDFSAFAAWLPYPQERFLIQLFKKVPQNEVPRIVIEGITHNAGSLSAETVFELAGLLASHLEPAQISTTLIPYLDRMIKRIPSHELDLILPTTVPEHVDKGVARFLWALLSDVDVRLRWRAAHAVCGLARFGSQSVLNALIECYEAKAEPTFRAPGAAFYWLAARLWLMIALDRIALESSKSLSSHRVLLEKVATDPDLPHVILRAFAKDAILKLVESGTVSLSAAELETVRKVNTSALPRQKSERYHNWGKSQKEEKAKPRFHFDPIDTIPYWYEPATRVFAAVGIDKFTSGADRWIIDQWKYPIGIWEWNSEPRRTRFSERDWRLSHNDHGGTPTIERLKVYLEWHAMCTVIGDLLQTEPLTDAEEDSYTSLEYWIRHEQLACPPWWLADLRTPKPLEAQFWLPPDEVGAWAGSAGNPAFLLGLLTPSYPDALAVWASHKTGSALFEEDVSIHSALVQPETASALVRALQTTDEPIRFGIPAERHDELGNLVVDSPPYRLLPWIALYDSKSGIDEKDPFCREVRGTRYGPNSREVKRLKQVTGVNVPIRWINENGEWEYAYEDWSDEPANREAYDYRIRSFGTRLHVRKDRLKNYLENSGMDLIVEVEMTRTKDPYERRRSDSKEAFEWRYEKILLLRRDGSIEGTEGRIGSWYTPST